MAELRQLVDSHALVEKGHGLDACREILKSVENNETEYGSRLGMEYKKSSANPSDKALILHDDGSWSVSSYLNQELDDPAIFMNLSRLAQAIEDVESCIDS